MLPRLTVIQLGFVCALGAQAAQDPAAHTPGSGRAAQELASAGVQAPAIPAVRRAEQSRSSSSAGIKVMVSRGDGAINRMGQPVAQEPLVRVTDRAGAPVKGAAVTFVVPTLGAGGVFPGGATTLTVTSDSAGEARASGLRANNVAGQFEVRVTASHQGETATLRVSQTNVAPVAGEKRMSSKRLAILVLVAGAVAGGAIAATSGGGSSGTGATPASTQPGAVLVPGTPTFSPPR